MADEEYGEPKETEEEFMEEQMRSKLHCGNFCCFCWSRRSSLNQGLGTAAATGRGSYKKVNDAPDFALLDYPRNTTTGPGQEGWPQPLCRVKPTPTPATAVAMAVDAGNMSPAVGSPDASVPAAAVCDPAVVASALHKEQE